ncbi:MAG: alkyl hydroperoxide reductase [Planctomycetota bacterium]|nr:MAG: alkyl hydroperoxide reductase [Planctomycetota bacterium]
MVLGGRCLWIFACLVVMGPPRLVAEDAENRLAFRLPTSSGETVVYPVEVDEGLTVVCFLGAECPLARLYGPRLQSLADQFASQGVRFIGVNSNHQDSMEDVRAYVEQHEIRFPIAKDYDHGVADRFDARRTPEVFLIDGDGAVRYRGLIDDQYRPGISRPDSAKQYLRDAIEQSLAGEPVAVGETDAVGCVIGRVRESEATCEETYCREVSRILQAHCIECHRDGEIGPFSLTDYDEVVGWGETMIETIDDGRMPPWHASPEHGDFANARLMPKSDKQALRNWVAGGMPFGDVADLPEPREFVDEWQLAREPDAVYEMRDRPFRVPAQGVVEYQYFVVDPGFEEDVWVRGAQVIPGNRAVVHHAIVFVRPPDGSKFRGMGWVAAYVPGQRSTMLPEHYARRIPAGSLLVFQMHYTPTGTEQDDLTRVGLVFEDEEDVTHQVFTLVALDQEFEIPPHADDYAVNGRLSRIPDQGSLLAIAPHMHVRGRSFELRARYDGAETTLLEVPHYDFNWQHVYELTEPLPLDDVDDLEFTVRFDNSAHNPFNPDPSQYVTWGDQTWEEMAIAFFEIAEPRSASNEKREEEPADAAARARRQEKIDDFVEQFFRRFDADEDGVVVEDEVPLTVQRFGFRQYDDDGDGRVTDNEIRKAAEREF